MMRTMVARQVRDELHAAEASMDQAVAAARATLDRLISAKVELGLTGTMGDAAIARMRDSVATLEQARLLMNESHEESYAVLKATNIRGVAANPTNWLEAIADEHNRAA